MYTPLNQYHVVMEVEPQFWQNPDGPEVHLRPRPRTASSSRSPRSRTTSARPRPCPSTTRASSRRSRSPSTCRRASRSATRSTRSTAAEAEMRLPATIRGSFPGTAQAFQASLANEPMLIAAALVDGLHRARRAVREPHPSRSRSSRRCRRPASARCSRCSSADTELTVIALIGIILLIGIVKKNAILMIDFALEAERSDGKTPEDAIFEACLLRFRPITMTTMAALLGGLPLALGAGDGLRAAPAARHRDRRRADLQPDADALHDAGRLPVSRPLPAALGAPARRAPAGRSRRRAAA